MVTYLVAVRHFYFDAMVFTQRLVVLPYIVGVGRQAVAI